MIPKTIHYIWFGREMPDRLKRCVDSWHKVLPDYEIKKWDETHFDFSRYPWITLSTWAYISDYARLEILMNEPGIYLDTDMELFRPFTDEMLSLSFFIGLEGRGLVNTAVLGSGADNISNEIYGTIKNKYHSLKQIHVSPTIATECLKNIFGLCDIFMPKTESLEPRDGCKIYSCEHFYPFASTVTPKIYLTKNTIGIHRWSFSHGVGLDQHMNTNDYYIDVVCKDKMDEFRKQIEEERKGG